MNNWKKYNQQSLRYPHLEFSLDNSRMDMTEDFEEQMETLIQDAFADMKSLEAGTIANPDEERMVGHYWLRNSDLAPTAALKNQINQDLIDIQDFAKKVHSGVITAPNGKKFSQILLIGIGGSALGPQLVTQALDKEAVMPIAFFDNTDPAGMDEIFAKLKPVLDETITLVVSKSGGTPETRNGMLEAKHYYESQGLKFADYAVAITGVDSKLDKFAVAQGWFKRFEMQDWVGGRTSIMSTVGLVPASLQGFDIMRFLAGARDMDIETRKLDSDTNAAMQLALAWYFSGDGQGRKDMVILPYKDSLSLMSKYLQQLVMESIGKKYDLDGEIVHQGIAVYGNKGSTDQHAYVQQLRDGVSNFFATFIEVREGREGESIEVEDGFNCSDYLQGFLRGTRNALYEAERGSVTISLPRVNAYTLGLLIALFERAVSFYASLVNVNAYHQPGVEAGKSAAQVFLDLLAAVKGGLTSEAQTAETIAETIDYAEEIEAVYHALVHLASNGEATQELGDKPATDLFKK